MSHLLLRRILPVSVVGHDMSQLYLQKHSNTHTHRNTFFLHFSSEKNTSHDHRLTHCSLVSLSPRHQHPPSFTNWPTMNGLLFVHLLLLLLPSFPLLVLPLPLPSSSRHFVFGNTRGEEGSAWMSVWTLVLFIPFLVPLASCFPSVSVPGESKRWAEGPLMYTEKEKGPS